MSDPLNIQIDDMLDAQPNALKACAEIMREIADYIEDERDGEWQDKEEWSETVQKTRAIADRCERVAKLKGSPGVS